MEVHFEKDVQNYKTTGVAARLGDFVGLQHLVWNGRPIDVFDNRGWSPLHEAANGGFSGCLEFLLRQPDVDPDWQTHEGETPILLAARNGHHQCLRALINFQADINAADRKGYTPLYEAIRAKSNDCIRLLIRKGAEVNHAVYTGFTPLHEAAQMGSAPITSYLLQQGAFQNIGCSNRLTPLFVAVQSGSIETVRVLLQEISSSEDNDDDVVNMAAHDNATPLLIAAQDGHPEIVDMLLQHGADPSMKVTETNAGPLQYAVYSGHAKCVHKLIPVTDLSLFEDDFGIMHPLVLALRLQNTDILQQLLAAGMSPHGVRPLDDHQFEDLQELSDGFLETGCRASLLCHIAKDMPISGAHFLLQRGLSPNVQCLNGVRELPPIVAAMIRENYPLFCLLLQYGAKANVHSARGNVSMLSALHCDLQNCFRIHDPEDRATSVDNQHPSSSPANGEETHLWLDQGHHSYLLHLFAAGGEVDSLLQNPGSSNPDDFGLISVLSVNLFQHVSQDNNKKDKSRFQAAALLALLFCLSCNMVSPHEELLKLVSTEQADYLTKIAEKNRSLAQLCRLFLFRKLYIKGGKLQDKIDSLELPQTVYDYLLFPELTVYNQTLEALLKSK